MPGAATVLAINIAVAGLFGLAFLTIAVNHKRNTAALWFALAYGLSIAYFALEFILPAMADPRPTVIGGFTAFLLALAALAVGVARRYAVPVPWMLLALVVGAGIVANVAGLDMPRPSFWRQFFYQAPFSACTAIAAWLILRAGPRDRLDQVFLALMVLSALYYLTKPFLAVTLGGVGASPQDYANSLYALFSQGSGAVLVVASGLTGVLLLTRDMLSDALLESQTDRLSGLYNRRGFEDRAAQLFAQADRVALVACDLDHFKSINDTFGHASGDRVIQAFAAHLRRLAPEKAICGRMGGEEFAVLLPELNLATASDYAEAVRRAFSAAEIEGLGGRHFTGSFGISARRAGDTLLDLLRRADAALYTAKGAGRDCVRLEEARA